MSKKNNRNQLFQSGPANLLLLAVIFLAGIVLIAKLTEFSRQTKKFVYSEFIDHVQKGDVAEIQMLGQEVHGTLQDGTPFETTVVNNPNDLELFRQKNIKISVATGSGSNMFWYLMPLFALLGVIAIAAWFFFRQSRGSNSGNGNSTIFTMGKSRARMYLPSAIKETFNSVAGAAEAKEELQDVVEFLKNPEKYSRLGAKITRGVLLVGDPGNGKTLLAKAVAGEANCPFFSISGSDFIEVFVGVGASRVRDLFAQARKHSPCIIFIDEIDAVGRQRGSGMGGGGNDEREQTLNQLLTEMDGFQTIGGSVIVLAATNRPDVLDKALLRPGRFDRQVNVPYPDLHSREQILRLHAKEIKLDPAVDLAVLAKATPGFSGADLANLINEAALQASKNPDKHMVSESDIQEARDKAIMGKQWKTRIMSDEERRFTAYHEAGHTLTRVLLRHQADPIYKVTILPRGNSLGSTHYLPEKERFTESKERKLATIVSALGGRAAEEVVFKTQDSGAGSDFDRATKIAREMVCIHGMSPELGPVIYQQQEGGFQYSQKTAEKIDDAVREILNQCMDKAKKLIVDNRKTLEALAQGLLDKDTLEASEVMRLCGITDAPIGHEPAVLPDVNQDGEFIA